MEMSAGLISPIVRLLADELENCTAGLLLRRSVMLPSAVGRLSMSMREMYW